jgi:pilus assembly protein CpaB
MRMRMGNLVALVIATLMGLGAVFLARGWINRQAPNDHVPTNSVVVTAARVTFGTALNSDNVVEIPWALPTIPDGAYATKDALFKDGRRVTLSPMEQGDLVLASKITGPGQRGSLSALLQEGHKAVTVRVDDVRGVAGFVLPGDRVDVVLIRSENRGNGQTQNTSDVLVQHVKVLAIDQVANERQEEVSVAKAVTLEVTTEQAQKILLATNIGKLSLVLRQAGQSAEDPVKRVTDADLGITASRSKTESQMATIDIIRGTKPESYYVQRWTR